MAPKRIIILGAGYAGLTATLQLQKQKIAQHIDITLINKHDYHYQTIWLHRNAAGTNSKERSAFDLKKLIDPKLVNLVTDCVTAIDLQDQVIHTAEGKYTFDYLVIALGSEIDSFQIPGLKDHSYSITSLSNASKLNQRIKELLNEYSQTNMDKPLHIVIGGGGFTGVVLLGELTDQLPALCDSFGVDYQKVNLLSIEHELTVLPEFDLELGEYAMQQLEKRNVEFRLNTKIKSISKQTIKVEQLGLVEDIPVDLFVWTAGVKGNSLIDKSDLPSYLGRVEVEDDLTAPGYPNVFVIGDIALIRNADGKPYLPNADIAIQEAKVAVKNLLAKVNGEGELTSFKFNDRGTIASIGAREAIGVTRKQERIFGKVASFFKKITDYILLFEIGGAKLVWQQLRKDK